MDSQATYPHAPLAHRHVHGWAGRDTHGPWGSPRRAWHGPGPFLLVMIAASQVIGTSLAGRGQVGARPLDLLGYLLLLAGPAVLPVRRRHPVVAYATALAASLGYALAGYPGGPFFLAALITLIGAASTGHRLAVWWLTGAAYLLFVSSGRLVALVAPGDGVALARPSLSRDVVAAAALGIALVLADGARLRAQHFAELGQARAEAARARAEQQRRQASEERLRIARELHDTLGHHLSLINVRAGVGLHLLDDRPDQARQALAAIKTASAEALREVRGVLASLRPEDESAPRSPAPGLAQLADLVAGARAGGLAVTVTAPDGLSRLPGEVSRAAYRIVQEALTNVRRHAGPGAAAQIMIGVRDSHLMVRVDDDGPGPVARPAPGSDGGNGIPGMRERAAALGGTLTAAPRADRGFRVEVRIPIPPEAITSIPPGCSHPTSPKGAA